MPIIRRANGLGSAGQAASAFDATTRDVNNSRIRLEQSLQQQQQRQEQIDFQNARQAEQDSLQRQYQERSLDIRERQIDSRNASTIRNQVGRVSQYGGQVNGQSMIQMASRVHQLDPEAYKDLTQQISALTGGEFSDTNPATPEALDAHPKRDAIYSILGGYLAPLEKAADQRSIQTGFQELEQNVSLMDPKWLETSEGVQWAAGLEQDMARAQRSGAGFTGAQARALYQEHQAKAVAAIDLHKRRTSFQRQWDAIRDDPKYKNVDADDWRRASIEMAGMGSSTDPHTKYVKAMTYIDPEFRMASQLAYERGQKEGALGAAAAHVRQQQYAESVAKNATEAVENVYSGKAAQQAELHQPPSTMKVDDISNAAGALGLDDAERRKIRNELKASGIDPDTDPDAARQFIRNRAQTRKMADSVYKNETLTERY